MRSVLLSCSVPVSLTWNDLAVPKCHLLHLSWLRIGAILDFIALFLLAAILLSSKRETDYNYYTGILERFWKSFH